MLPGGSSLVALLEEAAVLIQDVSDILQSFSIPDFFSILLSGVGDSRSLCLFFIIDGVHPKLFAALFSTILGLSSCLGDPHNLKGVGTFVVDRINCLRPNGLYSCRSSEVTRSQLTNGSSKPGNLGGL
uniref:Uncharacterized protein n=1 Tax=Arundo donax TaxID=35708 RepID=A0A0A9DVP1_ARUDO